MSNFPSWLVAFGFALLTLPARSWAAAAPSADASSAWWTPPLWCLLSVGIHSLLSRSLKATVAASRPLSPDMPEVGGYERTVYGTADQPMREIVLLVLGAGLLFWLAMTLAWPGLAAAGVVVIVGALVLDLRRWARVTVTADSLWFQRGLGQRVHEVPISRIRDFTVVEVPAPGLTLRHGRRNSLCRLNLRLLDKRIVALPKTDARQGLEAIEMVANHLRIRQQMASDRQTKQGPSTQPFDASDTLPASRAH